MGTSRFGSAGMGRVIIAGMACVVALAVTPVLSSDTRAGSQSWRSTSEAFVTCVADTTPQVCDPAHTHRVRVKPGVRVHVTRLRYQAASTHCSPGRLRVSLNGRKIGLTDWVEAGEESTVEGLDVTLRPRADGKPHRFKVKMEGKTEGCNVGFLGSWAGDITLKGTKNT